jgi:hypothetical protein
MKTKTKFWLLAGFSSCLLLIGWQFLTILRLKVRLQDEEHELVFQGTKLKNIETLLDRNDVTNASKLVKHDLSVLVQYVLNQEVKTANNPNFLDRCLNDKKTDFTQEQRDQIKHLIDETPLSCMCDEWRHHFFRVKEYEYLARLRPFFLKDLTLWTNTPPRPEFPKRTPGENKKTAKTDD